MTDKILEVRGLTKTYGGETKKGAKQPTPILDVLKGIDIDIYRSPPAAPSSLRAWKSMTATSTLCGRRWAWCSSTSTSSRT